MGSPRPDVIEAFRRERQKASDAAELEDGAHPEVEAMVQNLCEMGFPRSMVESCPRADRAVQYRAVQYLMNEIPASAQADLELQREIFWKVPLRMHMDVPSVRILPRAHHPAGKEPQLLQRQHLLKGKEIDDDLVRSFISP